MSIEQHYKTYRYKKISRWRKNAILSLFPSSAKKVLDIGCSDGQLGKIIKDKFQVEVHGLDISAEALALAQDNLEKTFLLDINSDEWTDKLTDNKYDVVILSEVLEHLFAPDKVLAEVKKILADKGEVIITIPNLLFWKNRLKIFLGKWEYTDQGLMDRGHIHFFSWHSFVKMLDKAGFYITASKHHLPTRGTKWLGKIFPGLFAYQFIVRAKPKKKVVYTAIFGNKDKLIEPQYVPDDFDFICFTDQDFDSQVWQIRKVKGNFDNPRLSAKIFKILPHRYLPEYELSIWVDGNILIKGNINKLVDKYLSQAPLAFFDHRNLQLDARSCIYQEAEALLEMAKKGKIKDDPNIIKKQVGDYRLQGYPEQNGLIVGGIILRKHNLPEVINLMEKWWEEINKYSIRDQLSFNFVAWQNNANFVYMEGDMRDNEFFRMLPHQHKR